MKKLFALILLVLLMVATFSSTALAANTTDTYYEIDATEYGSFKYTSGRGKENSTSIFAKVTYLGNLTTKVRARAEGANINASGYFNNCTLSNNADAEYVTLTINVNQSIRNMVNERGYSYARLGFQSIDGYSGQPVYGWWSPDSSMTHTVATT